MLKSIVVALLLSLIAAFFVISSQSKEVDAITKQLSEATEKLNQARADNFRLTVMNAILGEASAGLHGTKKDTLKDVNRVVDFVVANKAAAETKFSDCVDRKIKTTKWGSDGPWGVLDHCIDTIVDAKSAILIREIEGAVDVAREQCKAEGDNRFEAAKNCWADSNFRLLMGANAVLFAAITTPNWPEKEKNILSE